MSEQYLAAQRETATNDALMLKNAVELYLVTKQACPADVAALVEAKVIAKPIADPWGHDYQLLCRDMGQEISVTSIGPDGRTGSSDDIVTP